VPDKLPDSVVEHWPEIFEDIEIKAVPVEYLKFVVIRFIDGETWEIDVREQTSESGVSAEEMLEEFFDNYDDSILSVEFQLDTMKIKKDVQSRTKSFMKKRK
jgi:hypothetical protein|tara:strand:- start:30526 stop:30831 length:306 start_codon:yes stop_codon:yes gene_type:complete